MLPNAVELIRHVVRGEVPVKALEAVGVQVNEAGGAVEVVYSGDLVAVPDATDVAHGFRTYDGRSHDLRAWASVLLAGAGFLDLGPLGETPAGEALLEGLWDAADSGSVPGHVVRTVNHLLG